MSKKLLSVAIFIAPILIAPFLGTYGARLGLQLWEAILIAAILQASSIYFAIKALERCDG